MPELTQFEREESARLVSGYYEDFLDTEAGAYVIEEGGLDVLGEDELTRTFLYFSYLYFRDLNMDSQRAEELVQGIRLGIQTQDPDATNVDDQFIAFIQKGISQVVFLEGLIGARAEQSPGTVGYFEADALLKANKDSLYASGEVIDLASVAAVEPGFMSLDPVDLVFNEGPSKEEYQESVQKWVANLPFYGLDEGLLEQGVMEGLDLGVAQAFIRDNMDTIVAGFMNSNKPPDQRDSFMRDYLSSTYSDELMKLRVESDPILRVDSYDSILDPFINDRLNLNNLLPPDMYTLVQGEIKSWMSQVSYQNPELSKREVAESIPQDMYDKLVSSAIVDVLATIFPPEFLEDLQASGYKMKDLILPSPATRVRDRDGELKYSYPEGFGDIYEFAEQLLEFGSSIGVEPPSTPPDIEAINEASFFKQFFPSLFTGRYAGGSADDEFVGSGFPSNVMTGMSVFMRNQIIMGLQNRAGVEGLPSVITTENVGDFIDFFRTEGLARSVAEEVIGNYLRSQGPMGQLLLDQLSEGGRLLENFSDLEIPKEIYTADAYNASMAGLLSELEPLEEDFDLDAALADIVRPMIEGLPTEIQMTAALAANRFMGLQRDLYPEMDDEEILEMVGDDGGSFEDYIKFEIDETFSQKFAGDELLQDLFEAAGGALKFFKGMIPSDPDVDFNINAFFKALPQQVRDLHESGELQENFDWVDFEAFEDAFAEEAARDEPAIDFADTLQGEFILEQQRQQNQRSAERRLFDPALERVLNEALGFGQSSDVLRDFGDRFFEDFRRANPNIFTDQPSIATPEDVEATKARRKADEAMFKAQAEAAAAGEILEEEEVPAEEVEVVPPPTDLDETVPTPTPEEVAGEEEPEPVEPDEPEPLDEPEPTAQEQADQAQAMQRALEESIKTGVQDFLPQEDIFSFARESRTSRLRFFASGPRGGSRTTLARNIPLTRRGGR